MFFHSLASNADQRMTAYVSADKFVRVLGKTFFLIYFWSSTEFRLTNRSNFGRRIHSLALDSATAPTPSIADFWLRAWADMTERASELVKSILAR